MTYANFKTMVLSYLNRTSGVFTSGALDYVLIAMNDARAAAQREYAFNLNRTIAFANVSLVGQSILTDFDTTPGGSTLIVVKQIDAVYEYATATVGVTTAYYRTAKVPFWRHSVFDTQVPLSSSTFGSNTSVNVNDVLRGMPQFCYMQGNKLFHSTLTTATPILCDVIQWLPDHDGGSSEDVFLTYFVDWLKYATLINLNQFLKDSERFPIDASFVQQLWESVKQFDAQQAASTGSIDLN